MATKGWKIDNVCGFNLEQSVKFVGIFTMIVSSVALVVALVIIGVIGGENEFNTRPIRAINMLFSLYCLSISVYQIGISTMLVWKRTMFVTSVWYVSHFSIMLLYGLLFVAKFVVNYYASDFLMATLTILLGCVYEGVFMFLMVVVYSYLAVI